MENWIEIPAETIRQYTSDLITKGEFRHLSTITGYQDGETICILYHFLILQGALNVRVCVPLANPMLPSISPVLIGAILYEREIQDLLGVRFEGIVDGRRVILPDHFSGRLPVAERLQEGGSSMSEHITLPIGPQHPLLKEPIHFRFTLDGERIVDADIRMGYNHRGIEKAAEERTYIQDLYMIERICGICSHVHATNFVQATEGVLKTEVPPRALYLRIVVGELERIHSHLLWLGIAGHEIGFDTLFQVAWRDREVVQDLLELITGNRVNYGMNTIGGVRKDMNPAEIEETLKGLKVLEERTNYYAQVVQAESTFIARVSGVGPLPKNVAIASGAVGPTARGSGVDYDVRRDLPYAAYNEIPFRVITSDLGDVLGRALVRVQETIEAIRIIRYALEHLPAGPIAVRVPRKVPVGEYFSRYEAPPGRSDPLSTRQRDGETGPGEGAGTDDGQPGLHPPHPAQPAGGGHPDYHRGYRSLYFLHRPRGALAAGRCPRGRDPALG